MRIRALQHIKAGIKTFIKNLPSKNVLRNGDEVYVLAHNKLLRLVVKQNNKLWFALFKDEVPREDNDFTKLKLEDIKITNPSDVYNLSHDSFADYVANEHIDWTSTTQSMVTTGFVDAGMFRIDGTDGDTGTFDSADGYTITVEKGIITSIS